MLLNDLIDIKRMFEKIDSEHIADLISPNLYRVVDKVMVQDVRAVRTAKGSPHTLLYQCPPYNLPSF